MPESVWSKRKNRHDPIQHPGLHWQDGTYNGREWPPSPLRLFQALITGYRTARGPDDTLDAALKHLEGLEPPDIQAPVPARQSPVASAVPNNDGDRLMDLWAKGEAGKARAREAKLRKIRRHHPWRFDGNVMTEPMGPVGFQAASTCSSLDCLSVGEYVELIEWNGRILREDKPGWCRYRHPAVVRLNRLSLSFYAS